MSGTPEVALSDGPLKLLAISNSPSGLSAVRQATISAPSTTPSRVQQKPAATEFRFKVCWLGKAAPYFPYRCGGELLCGEGQGCSCSMQAATRWAEGGRCVYWETQQAEWREDICAIMMRAPSTSQASVLTPTTCNGTPAHDSRRFASLSWLHVRWCSYGLRSLWHPRPESVASEAEGVSEIIPPCTKCGNLLHRQF